VKYECVVIKDLKKIIFFHLDLIFISIWFLIQPCAICWVDLIHYFRLLSLFSAISTLKCDITIVHAATHVFLFWTVSELQVIWVT